jgi:hypothetical protein
MKILKEDISKSRKSILLSDINNIEKLKLILQNIIYLMTSKKKWNDILEIYLPIRTDHRGREHNLGLLTYISQKIIRPAITLEINNDIKSKIYNRNTLK